MRGGVISLDALERITANEQKLNDLKQTIASDTTYGLTKVISATDITQESGIALSAIQNNPSIDGTLANRMGKMSNAETFDVSWNDTTFPGGFSENIARKINRTIQIGVAKYNGVSKIPVGERVIIGKLDMYKPSFTKFSSAISANINGTSTNYCGSAQIRTNGDISIMLEKACDWLLFIEFIYLI